MADGTRKNITKGMFHRFSHGGHQGSQTAFPSRIIDEPDRHISSGGESGSGKAGCLISYKEKGKRSLWQKKKK